MDRTTSVFVGSTRSGRVGRMIAEWIARALEQRGHKVLLIDPNEHEELLTLDVPHHYNPAPSEDMQQISQWLGESDGFILLSPEYNHSFSGALKNALDNFMPEYEKKPFGIATYSVSFTGGVRANEALRPIVNELKAVPTPLPLLVPFVQKVFDEEGQLKDRQQADRLAAFLDDFEWYLDALKVARQSRKADAAQAGQRRQVRAS